MDPQGSRWARTPPSWLLLPSPHRVWSSAQTAAAQDVLPPACSLILFTWGTGKTLPVPLLPSYPEGMEATAWV